MTKTKKPNDRFGFKSLQQKPLLGEKGANETSATDATPVNVTPAPALQGGEPGSSASNQNNGLNAGKDADKQAQNQVTRQGIGDTETAKHELYEKAVIAPTVEINDANWKIPTTCMRPCHREARDEPLRTR